MNTESKSLDKKNIMLPDMTSNFKGLNLNPMNPEILLDKKIAKSNRFSVINQEVNG